MENLDVIIIGGGLGGLIAGAKLSKEGKKVFLIEQHRVCGGCATSFKRKGYTMEVGLHSMDGLDKDDPKMEIFNDLEVFKNVDFLKLPEFYRFKSDKVDIVIPNNTEEAIKVLIKKFPKENKGIRKFFKVIHSIRSEVSENFFGKGTKFPNLIFYAEETVGGFLDSTISDENLKLVLLGNLFFYHDDPYSLSLIYYSAGQAGYYSGGGHFIEGGAQKLSNYLAEVIVKNGGKVLLNHVATKIITKNDEVIGIEYKKTFSKEVKTKKLFAKTVVANSAIPNVVNLLPEENRVSLNKKINKLERSCSLTSVYIGFKKEIKELKNHCYITFILGEGVNNQKDMAKNHKQKDFKKKTFAFIDHSQINSGLAMKGKSFGSVCMVDYLSNWKNLSEKEYKKRKEKVAQIFFERLEKLIPGITKQIDCYEVGTPKTIKRYTLNPSGSVYGFAQKPKQTGIFRTSNRSFIKNLYFASAWANPGGGFSGAILSGWACVGEILKSEAK